MSENEHYPLLATFGANIRRPRPREDGMEAELFAPNGKDADAVLPLGKTELQDATAHVAIRHAGEDMGGFQAEIRRPKPLQSGMVACFFGENGANADAIAALSLSRFQDQQVSVEVRLVRLPTGATAKMPEPKGKFSDQATVLFKSHFLTIRSVWEALGTDEEFLAWVRTQACCISTEYGEHEGDVVPMHVWRLENGAGKGVKPPYSAIPGCSKHHGMQHQSGESAVGGAEHYDKMRVKYIRLWGWERVRQALGVTSMAHADPAAVYRWAHELRISHLLPPLFREAAGAP